MTVLRVKALDGSNGWKISEAIGVVLVRGDLRKAGKTSEVADSIRGLP